jgi:hypothetical protein
LDIAVWDETRRLASEDKPRALGQLWRVFTDDDALFQIQRPAGELPKKRFEKRVEKLCSALEDQDSATIAALPCGDALALAAALDQVAGGDISTGIGRPIRLVYGGDGDLWMVYDGGRRADRSRHAEQRTLQTYIRRHRFMPAKIEGYRIVVRQSPDDLDEFATADASMTVMLASFGDGVRPRFADGWAQSLSEEAKRSKTVDAAIASAVEGNATLVVLPELAVPFGLRDRLIDRLRNEPHPFRLIVPGTFHDPPGAGSNANKALLLDRHGNRLIKHRKLLGAEISALAFSERIVPGDRVEVLATGIGLIALLICRDFCDEAHLVRLRRQLAVDLILVPSMNETVNPHLVVASERARDGTFIAVANQLYEGTEPADGGGARQKSFCCIPAPRGEANEPSYEECAYGRLAEIRLGSK